MLKHLPQIQSAPKTLIQARITNNSNQLMLYCEIFLVIIVLLEKRGDLQFLCLIFIITS